MSYDDFIELVRTRRSIRRFKPDPIPDFYKNMANATQLIHLAAAALGLDSQWFSVNAVWETPLKALLGVPNELQIHTIAPIGYPAYKSPPGYRRNLKEIVHYERYDLSKYRSGEDIYNFLVDLRQRARPYYSMWWKTEDNPTS